MMFLTVVILLCSWQILIDINIKFSRRWKIASSICYLNSYNNMWSILRYIWTPSFLEEAQSVIGLGLNIANPKSKSGLSHLWREQIFTLRVWQVLGGKNILRQSLILQFLIKNNQLINLGTLRILFWYWVSSFLFTVLNFGGSSWK